MAEVATTEGLAARRFRVHVRAWLAVFAERNRRLAYRLAEAATLSTIAFGSEVRTIPNSGTEM